MSDWPADKATNVALADSVELAWPWTIEIDDGADGAVPATAAANAGTFVFGIELVKVTSVPFAAT